MLPLSDAKAKDGDDATSHASTDTSDEFVMSRTKSLDVLVPPGKSLMDVFDATSTVSETGAAVEFKEPQEMSGKFRWQIVRVLSDGGSEGRKTNSRLESGESNRPVSRRQQERKDVSRSTSREQEENTVSSQMQEKEEQGSKVQKEVTKVEKSGQGSENHEGREESRESEVQEGSQRSEGEENLGSKMQEEKETKAESPENVTSQPQEADTEKSVDKDKDAVSQHEQTELAYRRGMYLPLDATLKDLRNKFVESEQLDQKDGLHFQFLLSDVPGDRIELDTEDEVLLCQIESSLLQKRTLFIEAIDPGKCTLSGYHNIAVIISRSWLEFCSPLLMY